MTQKRGSRGAKRKRLAVNTAAAAAAAATTGTAMTGIASSHPYTPAEKQVQAYYWNVATSGELSSLTSSSSSSPLPPFPFTIDQFLDPIINHASTTTTIQIPVGEPRMMDSITMKQQYRVDHRRRSLFHGFHLT